MRAILLLVFCTVMTAQTLPPGFTDSVVFSLPAPTALAFAPDGRMFVTTQRGVVRLYQDGALVTTPVLTLPASRICTNSERGLLGIALDPDFPASPYVYLYYTYAQAGPNQCPPNSANSPVNRVSRFTLLGNIAEPASEHVLIDNIPSPNGNHNAGDVQFGKDGLLYISVGDGGCSYLAPTRCAAANDISRNENTLLGKIVRINKDGSIPSGNPFQGSGTARCNNGNAAAGLRCQETFVRGLRNPFRIAFDPNAGDTRFFINDVGQNTWEEIDEARSGADYGWNVREGPCANGSTSNCTPQPQFVDPVFAYRRDISVPGTDVRGCGSISGGAFVPNGLWSREYDRAYLFADYVCGAIFALQGDSAQVLARNLGSSSAVHLQFGPFGDTQALYYTTYAGGGNVRRITFASQGGGNSRPAAVLSATPRSGVLPLVVTFDGSASSDPDPGDTLTYLWDFGDGSTETSTAPVIRHTYSRRGAFTASLRVRDAAMSISPPATVSIFAGNTEPQPNISGPNSFRVGESIRLTGSANDAEDGQLPASSMSWSIVLHHAEHTHPLLGPVVGSSVTFTAPAPEDLLAAANSFLEVRLTATDSSGQSGLATRILQPNKVELTFQSQPSGLGLVINGSSVTTPAAVTSWEAYSLSVTAPDQSGLVFERWGDGGARTRSIITPSSAATYTAVYRQGTGQPVVLPGTNVAGPLAPDSIATAYGSNFTDATAQSPPGSPAAVLAGVTVRVGGLTAPIYFAGPAQVNFVMPQGVATGTADVVISGPGGRLATVPVVVEAVAPSLFTADTSGTGAAAAIAVSAGSGQQTSRLTFACEPRCTTVPIDVTQQTVLVLFGTGIRGQRDMAGVEARVAGVTVPVQYAGAQSEFPGLDQVNVALPRELAGRGETDVALIVGGRAANTVRINIR